MSKLSSFDLGPLGIRPLVQTAIFEMLEAIDTPVSLGVSLRLRSDMSDLPTVSPHNYLSPVDYAEDAQALAFVKKLSSEFAPKLNIDLREKAQQSFLELERNTAVWNGLLHSDKGLLPHHRAILIRARRIIAECLQEPDFQWILSFGPGTTLSKKGRPSHLLAKLGDCNGLSITPGAVQYMHKLCLRDKTAYDWFCSNGLLHPLSLRFTDQLKIVDYERFSTVPKDFSRLRAISIQPDCNIILQKIVGNAIRASYDRYFNTELRRVAEMHKGMMKFASETGCFSTIDLRNASDTIPYSLVKQLLPADWFRILADLRPNKVEINGELHSAERFSCNGCGYTFELETLVFRAICEAVLELDNSPYSSVSVFGDDIVVTSSQGIACREALEAFGFTANVDKTFIGMSPGFRESCGADWFNGQNVRPVYFKDFSNGIEGVYALANRITDTASISSVSSHVDRSTTGVFPRLESTMDGITSGLIDPVLIGLTHYLDRRYQRAFRVTLTQLPLDMRFGGPKLLGDAVITGLKPQLHWGKAPTITSSDSLCAFAAKGRGYFEITGLRQKPIKIPYGRLGSPYLQLVYVALAGQSEGLTPRGSPYSVTTTRYACQLDDVVWC